MRFCESLFINSFHQPIKFFIHDCKEKEFIGCLIKCGSGIVLDLNDGDYIEIAYEGFKDLEQKKVLGIDYIVACCMANCKLPLSDFTMTENYVYSKTFLEDMLLLRREYDLEFTADIPPPDVDAQLPRGQTSPDDDDVVCLSGSDDGATRCDPTERGTKATNGDGDRRREASGNGTASKEKRREMPTEIATQGFSQAKKGKLSEDPASSSSDDEMFVGISDRINRNPPPGVAVTFNASQGLYRPAERKAIMAYIVTKNAYARTSGRQLWQEMEQAEVCPGRTWPSLREHFTRRIKPRITQFGLTAEQIRKFRNV